MKHTKKLASLLLSLIMVMALTVPAFAANTVNITIKDPSPISFFAVTSKTYDGYRLLNLTTSLKDPTPEEGHEHTSECWNYAYTVNGTYRVVLQNEVFADDAFWGDAGKPSEASKVTDQQILDYLGGKTSDAGDTVGTLRAVADRLYKAIKDAKIVADAVVNGDTFSNVDQGYWLIADVTNLDANAYEANSLVVIDTKGQEDLTVTTKTSVPTVEKKVQDTNDSTGETSGWQDSADYDIGDDVPFQLTGTLPSNFEYYETYKYVFHDTLTGLTLNQDSVKVKIGSTDVTDKFDVKTTGLTDGCSFEVSCNDLKSISDVTLTKDSKIVVEYTAKLNEGAATGSTSANSNTVQLEFSNNPYDESKTGKTTKDEVIVFTYKVIINKVDKDGNALKGAEFTLEKKILGDNPDTEEVENEYWKEISVVTDTDGTIFTFTGLDDGIYRLTETKTPDGYHSIDPITFTVTAQHDVQADNPRLTSLSGNATTGEITFSPSTSEGSLSADVINRSGIELPTTGGMGTTIFYVLGGALVLGAVVLLITKKRMDSSDK